MITKGVPGFLIIITVILSTFLITLTHVPFATASATPTATSQDTTLNSEGLFPSSEEHTNWCFTMKSKYMIQPGQSFGKLPKVMHDLYLKAKCDQFFCKPHPGRGKFKCEPLAPPPASTV